MAETKDTVLEGLVAVVGKDNVTTGPETIASYAQDQSFTPASRPHYAVFPESTAQVQEIVKLVGVDALSMSDRVLLEIARSIREDFLHQNAFHEVDTYALMDKQYLMLKIILELYDLFKKALENGVPFEKLSSLSIREEIARAKYHPEKEMEKIEGVRKEMVKQVEALIKEEKVHA